MKVNAHHASYKEKTKHVDSKDSQNCDLPKKKLLLSDIVMSPNFIT